MYDKSIEDFKKAIKIEPTLVVARKNLTALLAGLEKESEDLSTEGLSLLSKSKLNEAIIKCSEAIRRNSRNVFAWRIRGRAHFEQKENDKAIHDLTEAIQLDTEGDAGAYLNRGLAYLLNSEPNKAKEDLAKAHHLNPELRIRYPDLSSLARLAQPQTPTLKRLEKSDTPALNTLKALLGKRSDRQGMADFRKEMSGSPEVNKFNDCFYHSWHEQGISFRFDENEILSTIFLYADDVDGFKQYRGELPEELQFSDTREDVENKLGQPKLSGGSGVIPYWVEYPQKGLGIKYVSKDTEDRRNRISVLTISAAVRDK